MQKLALLTLSIFLLASFSLAEVNRAKSPLGFETEAQELDALVPILDFVRELKGLFQEIEKIRKTVPESPTELIEILDMFNRTNTSSVCNSCLKFVAKVRTISDSKIIKNLIENTAETFCEKKQNKSVCYQAIHSYGDEVWEILLDRTIRPQRFCQRFAICPHVEERDHLHEFIKDVLKDKPQKKSVKPTKKKTYSVLQIADPHVDLLYKEGSDAFCDQPLCCREADGIPADKTHAAQHWGTYAKCDIPTRTFEQFLNFTSHHFDIDMIVWTGDNIAHDIWQQSASNQTLPTYDITRKILDYFPNTFVYPMFGNHEPYPCNQFDPAGNGSAWLTEQLSEMWKGWLDEKALKTFKEHSYYAIVNPEHNLKVIGLNTEACDVDDYFLIKDPSDPMGQLKWLREELYEAEKNGQSVFILGHIPTGNFGCYVQWSSRYRALVDRFSNIIRAQFFGHTHNDEFQVARSYADNSPMAISFIAPSFTTYSYLKPSFRIYEIDSETNIPVNYHQYRLDLDKWNKVPNGPIEWDLAYSFIEEYGLADMSPASFDKLAEKIKNDPAVARNYQFHHDSGSHPQGNLTESNNQEVQGRKIRVEHAKRKRGHEKTPGQYLGPRLASAKYGRDRRDRSRDRGRRSRSRDRGGYSRRYDDRDRGRYDDRDRGRGRYDDRDRGRGGYDRDDRRRR